METSLVVAEGLTPVVMAARVSSNARTNEALLLQFLLSRADQLTPAAETFRMAWDDDDEDEDEDGFDDDFDDDFDDEDEDDYEDDDDDDYDDDDDEDDEDYDDDDDE